MVDLFIGGREDAVEMLGIPDIGSDPDSLHTIAKQIVRQFPRMSLVAMTRREGISANHNNFGGMLYHAANDEVCFAPELDGRVGIYEIHNIVDRLGAGDAFTAGLIHALTAPNLRKPATAVAFATAAGCLAHSIEGDFNYVSTAEIEALMRGDSSGRVKR
jgi:2-dehydro-3-deoxygluconokinase